MGKSLKRINKRKRYQKKSRKNITKTKSRLLSKSSKKKLRKRKIKQAGGWGSYAPQNKTAPKPIVISKQSGGGWGLRREEIY